MSAVAASPEEEPDDKRNGFSKEERDQRHDFWFSLVTEAAANAPPNTHYIERTKPSKAIEILMMLEEQASNREIIAKCKTNYNVIGSIRMRFAKPLTERRKEFSKRFATVVEMATDLITKKMMMLDDDDDMLAATSLKDLALTAAIATDKGALMDGMATQTIEVRRGASIGDASKMIEEARARIAAKTTTIEAEIVTQDAQLAET